MKHSRVFAVVAILLVALTSPALAQFKNYEIKMTRKKLAESRDRSSGYKTEREKEIVYVIEVKNLRFEESPPLEVRYRVFYYDVKPGSKAKPEEKMVESKESIPPIEGMKSYSVETKPITLASTQLDPGWSWASGAKAKAGDRVSGYWIRLYDEKGAMIDEKLTPTTLAKRFPWPE